MTVHTPRLYGAACRPTLHHDATTPACAFAPGVSLAIASWDLAASDVLDIRLASGAIAHALVARFAVSGMDINIDGTTFQCRPWKAGDESLPHGADSTSDWTIERIDHD